MARNALMFQFPDAGSADKACGTLYELGYDPQPHGLAALHIHVEREDLTSALEIAQSHGGELVSVSACEETALTSAAYGMDALSIPAHTVNEDWDPAYYEADMPAYPEYGDSGDSGASIADDGSYDHFQAH